MKVIDIVNENNFGIEDCIIILKTFLYLELCLDLVILSPLFIGLAILLILIQP